ncbi:MAG: DUF3168 domain-containing protein [Hyphomonadaceae bacterium]|nr:DUF3168 domain-containing protein [Hyphomonadaceae bacterium]
MSGAEAALEVAILQALRADENVAAVLGDPLRVGEIGGPRLAFPYLEFGRHGSEPAGGADVEMSTHRVDLVCVSRDGGGVQAKEAIATVRSVLGQTSLDMEGWRCVLLVPVFTDAMRPEPGQWRALLRLKAVVEAA